MGREWRDKFPVGENGTAQEPLKVSVVRIEPFVEIKVPAEMAAGQPEVLAFEWD